MYHLRVSEALCRPLGVPNQMSHLVLRRAAPTWSRSAMVVPSGMVIRAIDARFLWMARPMATVLFFLAALGLV
jgi:hypothetical protein